MKPNHGLIYLFYLLFLCTGIRSQNIYTVAGSGTLGYSGDGNLAVTAQLSYPHAIAVDNSGALYIADTYNDRIRKVNPNGIITTIAGTGVSGFSGDGGPAVSAQVNYVLGIAVDQNNNIYISDNGNNRIRKINPAGIITTIAGTGIPNFSGDGGPANLAEINSPYGITTDALGNILFADRYNNRIRKINASGIISTVAGNGNNIYAGDGGSATSASIPLPVGLCVDINNMIVAVTAFVLGSMIEIVAASLFIT